jgi:hypothetical protein
MSPKNDKRLAAIRAKVLDERARLSELNKQISVDLKEMLKPAASHLDDAEGWLVPEVLRYPPRSDNEMEMARWLRFVEGILDRAITHRKWVEAAIKKYGPDARLVGG